MGQKSGATADDPMAEALKEVQAEIDSGSKDDDSTEDHQENEGEEEDIDSLKKENEVLKKENVIHRASQRESDKAKDRVTKLEKELDNKTNQIAVMTERLNKLELQTLEGQGDKAAVALKKRLIEQATQLTKDVADLSQRKADLDTELDEGRKAVVTLQAYTVAEEHGIDGKQLAGIVNKAGFVTKDAMVAIAETLAAAKPKKEEEGGEKGKKPSSTREPQQRIPGNKPGAKGKRTNAEINAMADADQDSYLDDILDAPKKKKK